VPSQTGGERRYVAVVGPGEATETELSLAAEVGRLLAERGAVVITGGLGGVMAAAARGCTDAGGIAVALLPGGTRAEAHPHSSIVIPTGLGELRNGLIVRAVDAVIAIGGSWGTLSEIALARRTNVPVTCLGSWQVTRGSAEPVDLVRADSAADAVEFALAAAGS
jgi:hypothetical protein